MFLGDARLKKKGDNIFPLCTVKFVFYILCFVFCILYFVYSGLIPSICTSIDIYDTNQQNISTIS